MPITLTVKDRIAEIVFDVPPVNAFDSETYMSIPAIVKEAAANPEANVILIRAAEEARCAYADVFGIWKKVLERKDLPSLLANNINHPSDFGHGLYFEALKAVEF